MEQETKTSEFYVFMVYSAGADNNNTWVYTIKNRNGEWSTTPYIEMAKTWTEEYIEKNTSEIVDVYYHLIKMCGGKDNVRFERVNMEIRYDNISLDDGVYLEERRRKAIGKLRTEDIEALGVGDIATYIKTKYHNKLG